MTCGQGGGVLCPHYPPYSLTASQGKNWKEDESFTTISLRSEYCVITWADTTTLRCRRVFCRWTPAGRRDSPDVWQLGRRVRWGESGDVYVLSPPSSTLHLAGVKGPARLVIDFKGKDPNSQDQVGLTGTQQVHSDTSRHSALPALPQAGSLNVFYIKFYLFFSSYFLFTGNSRLLLVADTEARLSQDTATQAQCLTVRRLKESISLSQTKPAEPKLWGKVPPFKSNYKHTGQRRTTVGSLVTVKRN